MKAEQIDGQTNLLSNFQYLFEFIIYFTTHQKTLRLYRGEKNYENLTEEQITLVIMGLYLGFVSS